MLRPFLTLSQIIDFDYPDFFKNGFKCSINKYYFFLRALSYIMLKSLNEMNQIVPTHEKDCEDFLCNVIAPKISTVGFLFRSYTSIWSGGTFDSGSIFDELNVLIVRKGHAPYNI